MNHKIKTIITGGSLAALSILSLAAQTNQVIANATNAPAATESQSTSSGLLGFAVLNIVPLSIIAAVLLIVLARVILSLYFRHRHEKLLHETLRSMIEKGVAIPPDLLKQSQLDRPRRPRNDLRTGLLLLGVGVGVALYGNHNAGLIVVFMGVAFVVVYAVERLLGNNNQQPPVN